VVSELVFLPACTLHVTLTILGDGIHITYKEEGIGELKTSSNQNQKERKTWGTEMNIKMTMLYISLMTWQEHKMT
jgi:hypothetical protein